MPDCRWPDQGSLALWDLIRRGPTEESSVPVGHVPCCPVHSHTPQNPRLLLFRSPPCRISGCESSIAGPFCFKQSCSSIKLSRKHSAAPPSHHSGHMDGGLLGKTTVVSASISCGEDSKADRSVNPHGNSVTASPCTLLESHCQMDWLQSCTISFYNLSLPASTPCSACRLQSFQMPLGY